MKHTAKEIKQVLKNNGFKTQKISARDGYITIKDLSISCHQVAKLLQKELGISIYDVEYDMDVFEELVNSKIAEASQLLEEIKAGKEVSKEFGEYVLTASAGSNGFSGSYAIQGADSFHFCNQFKNVYDLAYGLATLEAH
ncbi:hypothetical protein [Streptococcus suis]|uniref:hypothetical protein n=1 Tax=Streptococcus suis TaxID=1307 RepID=UPI00042266CA|nr:hypothetical protein [Streptococcus suis]